MWVYENAEDKKNAEKRGKEEKRKYRGMKRYEPEKKITSIQYMGLGAEGKRIFKQKHSRVKVWNINFNGFFDLLVPAFVKPANIMFELNKLLSPNRKTESPIINFA